MDDSMDFMMNMHKLPHSISVAYKKNLKRKEERDVSPFLWRSGSDHGAAAMRKEDLNSKARGLYAFFPGKMKSNSCFEMEEKRLLRRIWDKNDPKYYILKGKLDSSEKIFSELEEIGAKVICEFIGEKLSSLDSISSRSSLIFLWKLDLGSRYFFLLLTMRTDMELELRRGDLSAWNWKDNVRRDPVHWRID